MLWAPHTVHFTLCYLLDFPIHMGLSIIYFKGSQVGIPNYDAFLSLETVLTSAKSVDPDEMPHDAAFHLGLHRL